jgi:hypothetical protein
MRSPEQLRLKLATGLIDEERVRLAAFCGDAASATLLDASSCNGASIPLNAWIARLKDFGVQCMVRAALAAIHHSFGLLARAPWIIACSEELVRPAVRYATDPSDDIARECETAARRSESLADQAQGLSTDTGDWWSFKAVEMIGLVPAAIALHARVRGPSHDVPGPPVDELRAVCEWYAWFPAATRREESTSKAAMAAFIVPWALAEQENLSAVLQHFK